MSEDNTWPDPARPGVPLNPERDGWHLLVQKNAQLPEVWEWKTNSLGAEYGDQSIGAWLEGEGDVQPEDTGKWYRYLGPCLTPAEVDARVKEARRDALKKLERHFKEAAAGTPLGHENRQRGASTYNWLIYCASIISALGETE